MAGPLIATKAAPEAVQSAVKVLSTDIVKVEGKVYRRVKKRIPLEKDGKLLLTKTGRVRYTKLETLEPVDVSLHANPIGLGVLAAGVALGAGILFSRIRVGVPGVGELTLYEGPLAPWWDGVSQRLVSGQANKSECGQLLQQFNLTPTAALWDEAHALGCSWTMGPFAKPRPEG